MMQNADKLGYKMANATTSTVEHEGRFYIAMGQPGYNTLANNRDGYATQGRALATIARYTNAARVRAEKAAR